MFLRLRISPYNPNYPTPCPMKKSTAAFTLIEFLVVITIIAVLASIALPVSNGVNERGEPDQRSFATRNRSLALTRLRSTTMDRNPPKRPGA